jgi:hypothetical protein
VTATFHGRWLVASLTSMLIGCCCCWHKRTNLLTTTTTTKVQRGDTGHKAGRREEAGKGFGRERRAEDRTGGGGQNLARSARLGRRVPLRRCAHRLRLDRQGRLQGGAQTGVRLRFVCLLMIET